LSQSHRPMCFGFNPFRRAVSISDNREQG